MIKLDLFKRFLGLSALISIFSFAIYLLISLFIDHSIAYFLTNLISVSVSYIVVTKRVFSGNSSLQGLLIYTAYYFSYISMAQICYDILSKNTMLPYQLLPWIIAMIFAPLSFCMSRFTSRIEIFFLNKRNNTRRGAR